MVSLACAIILLHAVVPHHHADDCLGGECFFCTEHHHGHCHHHHSDGDGHSPLDCCKLQEMLSHLVLSTKDDELFFADLIQAESNGYLLLALPAAVLPPQPITIATFGLPFRATPLAASPLVGGEGLRAPPRG